MTASELKPCPFCGNDGSGGINKALHCSGDPNIGYCVQCDVCTATMGYSYSGGEEDDEKAAIEAWNTRAPEAKPEKMAPVQGWPSGIPWWLHLEAYEVYVRKYGEQKALIDLEGRGCRGGFSTGELDAWIPGWRDKISDYGKLKAELAELKAKAITREELAKVLWLSDGNPEVNWQIYLEQMQRGERSLPSVRMAFHSADAILNTGAVMVKKD